MERLLEYTEEGKLDRISSELSSLGSLTALTDPAMNTLIHAAVIYFQSDILCAFISHVPPT